MIWLIKAAGLVLIVLCSSMVGGYMASGLSSRVSEIERCIALLQYLRDRLSFLQPSLTALLESAAGVQRFGKATYLVDALSGMKSGVPFPQSWRGAVEQCAATLGNEEARLVAELGDVLGSTDLDSQLTALSFTCSQLEARLEIARQRQQKHQRLYRTLGVLCGLAIVIVLI